MKESFAQKVLFSFVTNCPNPTIHIKAGWYKRMAFARPRDMAIGHALTIVGKSVFASGNLFFEAQLSEF